MQNMDSFRELLKKNKKPVFILGGIFLVGIFLRTYQFHDWLRFSHDQARDAWLVGSAIEGRHALPLLGPNAGTTAYQLGPIYYYFSYLSGKILGNYPDKLAYPSLIFSILSIPLLWLFLRKFFATNIALAMTIIASVSYFLVINSRFSSNPNLITFFVLLYLYALLEILNNQKKSNLWWSVGVGAGLGVGIQLHTTLLIAMPLVTLVVFAYLLRRKFIAIWKSLLIIFVVTLVLNGGQVYHEFQSYGKNSRIFLAGFQQSSGKSAYGQGVFSIAACQIQANSHIISSFQEDDRCRDIFHASTGNGEDRWSYYLGMTLAVLFSAWGYFLLGRRFWQEKEMEKKNFLGLVILFNVVSLAILVPIADMIYVGYFINLFFIPFILLGLILEALQQKLGKIGLGVGIGVITVLLICSLDRDIRTAASYRAGLENNAENSTLGEVERMKDYIFATLDGQTKFYFSGQEELKGRFFYPIEYFARRSGVKIEKVDLSPENGTKLNSSTPIYYIEANGAGRIEPGQTRAGHQIISSKQFASQTILLLGN